jgi:hypothetical protein
VNIDTEAMSLRKTFYQTTFTPIPSHIPRQLAIDLLHNHSEIIELNPLVIGHQPIKPPPKAPADEYYSTWYEINQRIQFIPGTGKVGSGKISFNGVFHDLPTGVQTHVYAAAGVDIRHNYTIGGNQPGEPPQPKELGSGAPANGLHLKQDVTITCNLMMISFVKKEMKSATEILLARLVKKAELIDAGVLHAMMDDGKLKTINPANRSSTVNPLSPGLSPGFPASNRSSTIPYLSPRFPPEGGFAGQLQNAPTDPGQSQYGHRNTQTDSRQSQYGQPSAPQGLGFELPADNTYPANTRQYSAPPAIGFELPADNTYPVQSPTSSHPSDSQPSTDRTSYYEMSGESATPHHEPMEQRAAVEQKSPIQEKALGNPDDRLSSRYYDSERIAKQARRTSWTPDDDKR